MTFTEILARTLFIGLGASLIMDAVAALRQRWFGIAPLDYRLLGRWVLWMGQGRLRHDTILHAPPCRFERPLGWVLHYLIGILWVAAMLAVTGPGWLARPGPIAPLLCGLISVLAPFAVMQPALGFGWAAARTPHPWVARGRSLFAHLSFGLGIYVSALALSL